MTIMLHNTDMSDDDDHISKETRNIFTRGKYAHTPILSTTRLLLRLPSLKHIVQVYIVARCGLNVIKVQLVNKTLPLTKLLKVFMNVPSFFSPSWLFLICDVFNFAPLRRKLVLSLMKRIKTSTNVLISNSYNFLMTNVMQRYWHKLLRLRL